MARTPFKLKSPSAKDRLGDFFKGVHSKLQKAGEDHQAWKAERKAASTDSIGRTKMQRDRTEKKTRKPGESKFQADVRRKKEFNKSYRATVKAAKDAKKTVAGMAAPERELLAKRLGHKSYTAKTASDKAASESYTKSRAKRADIVSDAEYFGKHREAGTTPGTPITPKKGKKKIAKKVGITKIEKKPTLRNYLKNIASKNPSATAEELVDILRAAAKRYKKE